MSVGFVAASAGIGLVEELPQELTRLDLIDAGV